jgi:hydrogenase maturation protease
METSPCNSSRKPRPNEKARIGTPAADIIPPSESIRRIPAFLLSPSRQIYGVSSPPLKFWPSQKFMHLLKSLFKIPERIRHPELHRQMETESVALGLNLRKPLILVAGLGNVFFQDDGVGIHVIREFQKTPIPKIVCAEVGTVVLGALHLFEWADKILAVDAMRAGGKPGTLYTVGISDVERPGPRASLHQQALLSTFKFLSRKIPPEINILGIEPETTAYGLDLSPSVKGSLSLAAQSVKKIIQTWLK